MLAHSASNFATVTIAGRPLEVPRSALDALGLTDGQAVNDEQLFALVVAGATALLTNFALHNLLNPDRAVDISRHQRWLDRIAADMRRG